MPDLGEIVIQDKGQIGLSAAEVDHAEGLVGNIVLIFIINDLQEPVDLFEFIIPGADDLSFRRQYAHIHQRGNNHAFLQDVVLLPVGKGFRPVQNRRLICPDTDVGFSFFGQQDFNNPPVRKPQIQLAVGFPCRVQTVVQNLLRGNCLVENLGDCKGGNKEGVTVSFGTDLPVFCFGRDGVAENEGLQRFRVKRAQGLIKGFVIHINLRKPLSAGDKPVQSHSIISGKSRPVMG